MQKGSVAAFRRAVWKHYHSYGRRTLPWRTTTNPYRILVSEVMLQQTQVERVIPYYHAWMQTFPNVKTLAKAPLSSVLRAWQGLGYNRRAKNLHQAAQAVVSVYKGTFPKHALELQKLPGVGPYTAHAVAAFAYNEDGIFVETNIRTVVMHHFFSTKKKVSDDEIRAVLEQALPKGRAREWYAALMDYGSYLKRSGVRLNAKTKQYTKQSTFRGSNREARGAILKALVQGSQKNAYLTKLLGPSRVQQMNEQLTALTKEGMVTHTKGLFRLPG